MSSFSRGGGPGLLAALQKIAVQWVRVIPEHYEAIQGPEGVAILSIKAETYVREDEEE